MKLDTPIAIDRARYWALTTPTAAFYGSLAGNLIDVIDDRVPTAATDGTRIIWNPTWVATLTEQEVRFVLLHETLHCAHNHFDRLPHTEEGNVAGDYAINATLEKIAGITMPKGGLRDQRYDDMAEEEILTAIRKQPKPQPQQGQGQGQPQQGQGQPQQGQGQPQQGQGQGQPQQGQGQGQPDPTPDVGGCGTFIAPTAPPPPALGKTPPPTLKEKWERALIGADMARRQAGRGTVSANLQAEIDRLTATAKVDWRQETADFVKSAISTRNDWSRSSRRKALEAVIHPRRKRDGIGLLVVGRDTSGSIDRTLCAEFTAQINLLCAEVGCEAIVIDCDTEICAEYRVGHGDEAPLEAKGGGGTSFDPVFARVTQLIEDGEHIAGLVYLTDGDGDVSVTETDYPVLWGVYGGRTAPMPIGRTITVE
jgi:predicted metal-dependent peptidase